MIRGRKHFLPSVQLVMGFGFLFRLADESIDAHRGDRVSHAISVDDEHKPDVAQSVDLQDSGELILL
jgi:hypothetical protein